MAINEPTVESARLVGSKPGPETISKQKVSTKILIDSCRVFLKYAKREQVKELLMLAGWSNTQWYKPMSILLETY